MDLRILFKEIINHDMYDYNHEDVDDEPVEPKIDVFKISSFGEIFTDRSDESC